MNRCSICKRKSQTNTYSCKLSEGITFIELCNKCEKNSPSMFIRHYFKSDYENRIINSLKQKGLL